jgi:3-Ketosteroid 9alpha-hydroxylase C-terminal domain
MTLDPRPIGWFALARADQLRPGEWTRGVVAASPYRLRWRGDGAGFELIGDGLVDVDVVNGFVFAWHHPRGHAPTWRVPVLDPDGWRPLRHAMLRARTHPQEVYENSIDVGHFPVIHGYSDIEVLEPMRLRGHEMDVRYQITRRLPIPFVDGAVRARFQVHLHGLGVAHNHIEVPLAGLRVRMLALATPTEPGHVDIRLAVTIACGGRVPRPLRPLVHRAVQQGIVGDFRQDVAIWEHKRHVHPPLLVKGDGPIASFRTWSAQFYAPAVAA